MLQRRLYSAILKVTYAYSLVVGLLPAPLDWQQQPPRFRPTRVYSVYRGAVHCVWLAALVLTVCYFYPRGYMSVQPVLQWTYTITHASKVLAIVLLLEEVWRQRRPIMQTYDVYCALRQRYRLQQRDDGERHIERLLVCKFFAAYGSLLMMSSTFLRMHPGREGLYLAMTVCAFLLNTLLHMANDQFGYALCQVYRQFACVNRALSDALQQLRASRGAPEELVQLAERVATLTAMHLECFRLAQRVFTISETSMAAILLRLFTTNTRIVYHAVLLIGHNYAADGWTLANELMLTITFYCDAALIMAILETLLTACNDTAPLLRECGTVELELQLLTDGEAARSERLCMARALDSLALQLRCYRLHYNVCGLFEFNKEASLCFFLSVLVKVTVLVQFHMQDT